MSGPLRGMRVVDLADEPAVFATRILADLGADVVRVEPEGGGRLRRLGPYLGEPGPETGFQHLYHNANKRSVVGGDDVVRRLASAGDVLVETGRAPPYEELAAENPGLVYVSVRPYGLSGPWAGRHGTDLTTQAAGGLLYVSGPPDSTPTQAGGDQSWKMAGLVAAAGAVAALYGRDRSADRAGVHLDISVQECVAVTVLQTSNPNHYAWHGRVPKRPGLTAVHRTADGRYVTSYPSRNRIATLVEWARSLGLDDDEADIDRAEDLAGRTGGLFRAIASKVTQEEWMREVAGRDIWSLPVNTLADMRTRDHFVQTRQFVDVRHEPLGVTLQLPRSPVDACGPDLPIRRAPLLGEHTGEVLASLPPEPASARVPVAPLGVRPKPLDGVRVLDFCWVLAGPLGTKILANLGAEVIRVETAPDRWFPDFFPPGRGKELDLGAFHNNVNTGKRSVTIDPRTERGRDLLLRLAERCDVVTDNYRPGALAEMGFGYDVLRERNPGIVVAHLPGCGSEGPWSTRPTLGNMIVAASGISVLTGFPGRSPRGMGVAYPDFSSPFVLTTCVVAALLERDRTGTGRELDISQLSATVSLVGAEWMQYAATGVEPPPRANRDPNHAPHGVYPCAGTDEWVAIAVEDDDQWRTLCRLTGMPDDDPRFATHDARKANEDDLDDLVSAWTRTRDRWEIAGLLQAHGIAAAAVESLADALDRDPQLANHYHRIRRPEAPDVEVVVHGEPIRQSGAGWELVPAPSVGADNAYVCLDLLGMTPDDLAALYDEKVIAI